MPMWNRFVRIIRPVLIVLVSLTGISLQRCASSRGLSYLHPDYTMKQQVFSTLLVLPLTNAFLTRARQDSLAMGKPRFIHYLDHRDQRYFDTYFRAAVSDAVQASVPRTDAYYIPEDIDFEYRSLPLPGGSEMQMFVPASGMIVYRNIVPNFVLFIEDLRFQKGFSLERGARGIESDRAQAEAGLEYLFWDNTREMIAAYGMFQKKFEFLGAPTKENYLRMFGEIAATIAENSPFSLKSVPRERSRSLYP